MQTKSTSLTSLPQKKITTGLKRLQEAGLTPDNWLKMLNLELSELQHIVTAFPGAAKPISMGTGIVYSAAMTSRLLGLHCNNSDPVPKARDGEIVIYYGGWDLTTLRSCLRMQQDNKWYDNKMIETAKPGYYRVLLYVPNSNGKSWNEQVSHLKTFDKTLQPAPVTVATTALLVHLVATDNDLLNNNWCRCAEILPDDYDYRTVFTVHDGRACVNFDADGYRNDRVWLSAAQKI